MHNGVLSTGNKANIKMSDTWHYINDYLKPMLAGNPDFAFHPAFKALVADHIGGSNKFVLMDNEGRQVVINQDEGVYWGGLWLSNTYAWSASKSAGKHPVNIKKAKKQVKEMPEVRSFYKYSYIPTTYEYSGNDEYTIQSNLDDLEYFGISHGVTVGMGLDFVDEFGMDSFLDVVDQAVDKVIDGEWFTKVIGDHSKAREVFPYLGRYTV
jgi:hypothetical protein